MLIGKGEAWLNKPPFAFVKRNDHTLFLSAGIFIFVHAALTSCGVQHPLYLIVSSICVFYGLANRQLITEGKKVFATFAKRRYRGGAQPSVPDRRQGYHQSQQSADKDRRDGDHVGEPGGWGDSALVLVCIAGAPGMLTYKMVNTLDSMIGYRNERYGNLGIRGPPG